MNKDLTKNFPTDEDGFLLIEILVAIAVTGIIISFIFGIYLYGQRYFSNWRDRISLQNEAHVLAHNMSAEIWESDRILDLSKYKIILEDDKNGKRIYEVKASGLFRNDKNLLSHAVSLVSFNISSENRSDYLPGSHSLDEVALIEISLALTNGMDTLNTIRKIHLRKPSNWNDFETN